MTRYFSHLQIMAVFALAVAVGGQPTRAATVTCNDVPKSEETCGQYGTTVSFAKSPAEAARQAIEDEKLVFVLHVSGNFETPDYT